jgi:formiminoglutamase
MSNAEDPLWPRASGWVTPGDGSCDVMLLGVPANRTSISATGADTTPAAIRAALTRYSTYSWAHDIDLARLHALDAGDVDEPDGSEGEARVMSRVRELVERTRLLVALGGDNSITYSVARGVFGDDVASGGLITLDAHHDLRDGISNGAPVRRLVEAGIAGANIVQIGIADFSNSREYAARARDLGITVVTRDALRRRPISDAMSEALAIAGGGGGPIHVDLDVDVCDRAVVPGCPAAAPGGLTADELRQVAFQAGRSPRVHSLDITEIDASADAPDQRTVRLGALLVLEAACGLAARPL